MYEIVLKNVGSTGVRIYHTAAAKTKYEAVAFACGAVRAIMDDDGFSYAFAFEGFYVLHSNYGIIGSFTIKKMKQTIKG